MLGVYTVGLNNDDTASARPTDLVDVGVAEALPRVARGLDDLRRLGAIDLEMNHPE